MLPSRALIGMVHTLALPGAPASSAPIGRIVDRAVAEARVLRRAGFDAVIVENMHDRPYVNGPHGPETTAAMTRIALAVRETLAKIPIGVQVLSLGHREALAIALAAECQFIRVENFVFSHVADEGLMAQATAPGLLRYRREIGAERIRIFADLKKKHASHAITGDISLAEAAHGAEFFGADGLIVTGAFTGDSTDPEDLSAAKGASSLPVLVGSGVTPAQVRPLLAVADGLIVGSSIKRGGVWSNVVDEARCRRLVKARG